MTISRTLAAPRLNLQTGIVGAPRLVLASALMLFLQLALIRWCGANLVHLSYFSNLILLASFLGIGLGFLRSSRPRDWSAYSPVALLLLVTLVTVFPARIEGSSSELIFFTMVHPTGLPTWVSLPAVFLLVASTMTLLGETTGRAFREFPALTAYRWDIIGSILGTVTFTVLSFLHAPPLVWSTAAAIVIWLLHARKLPTASRFALIALVGVLAFDLLTPGVSWSPYYKVRTFAVDSKTQGSMVSVTVNGIPHQNIVEINQRLLGEPVYGRPYERAVDNPLRNVLIIGAGTGADVALALQNGAQHVDAVEIDPVIARLGRDLNPNHPYQDPRVALHLGDGRAFLSRTTTQYDLILFALPDSLTLVSGASQLRLESYLFTRESIASARDHLSEVGAFAMYNYYREDWLVNRLASTVSQVFGYSPCLDTFEAAAGLAAITAARNPQHMMCAPAGTWSPGTATVPAPATDDHPFVYLKNRVIPPVYLIVLALILAVSLLGVALLGGPLRNMTKYRDLFFMGAAFLLLETKSVTTFALLFGTTWLVNSLVFTGVLLAVLAAIELTRRYPNLNRTWITVGIFASLAVAFLIPNAMLLSLDLPARAVCAVALAFTPIFFANLLFATRFQHATNPTAAFAANLFGAMVGGCLEYLSLITGYQALLLVAGVLYLAAVLTSRVRPGTGRDALSPS